MVLIRRVVHDEVDHDLQSVRAGRPYEFREGAEVAQPGIDREVVGDVIAVVVLLGGVERHQPQARHAEAGEVVQPLGQPLEVPDAISV